MYLQFVRADIWFTLQAQLASIWQDVYRFTLDPQLPIDHQVANWFTSTHPNSLFRSNLLIERLTPDSRISLFNKRLTHRYPDGRVEESILPTPGAFGQALAADFSLEPPADPGTLSRVCLRPDELTDPKPARANDSSGKLAGSGTD